MNSLKNRRGFNNTGEHQNQQRGKVFQRYNIPLGKIEYYFIPSEKIEAYKKAVFHQDLDAPKKLGIQVSRM